MRSQSRSPQILALIGIGIVFGLALALRLLGLERVFPGDGEVMLANGDGFYHARLALYSFENFPHVLLWDTYLNFPGGSPVPYPPLFDLLVAGVARGLGSSERVFESVLAWSTPVLSALATIPVYIAARIFGGRGFSLAAAALYAAFGASFNPGRIGMADHHALVGLLSAVLLAACLTALRDQRTRILPLAIVLGLARLAILLAWNGSVMYLALVESTLLLGAALTGRRDLFWLESASALGAAALATPLVLAMPTPPGGDFSAAALSMLHPTLLLGVGIVAGLAGLLEGRRPLASSGWRLARTAALGAGIALALLAYPPVREGVVPALRFASLDYEALAFVQENQPMFRVGGRPGFINWLWLFGYFGPVILLLPWFLLAHVSRQPGVRLPGLGLAWWSGVLGLLAILQVRYANDFAPAAAVGLALFTREGAEALRSRWGLSRRPTVAAALGVAMVMLFPIFRDLYVPLLRGSLAHARTGDGASGATAPDHALVHFARAVRAATPETAGFLDASASPEYGILCSPNLGHLLRYEARRPVTSDGFWDFIDAGTFRRTIDFFGATEEEEAVELASSLRARYVVTSEGARPGTLAARLHHRDGSGSGGSRPAERFRLITEVPASARPPGGGPVRYKLFEVVAGALLEIPASPGATFEASVPVDTPGARTFWYAATFAAGDDGVARVRLPYATHTDAPAGPRGPYRIRGPGIDRRLQVTDSEVLTGATVSWLGAAPR